MQALLIAPSFIGAIIQLANTRLYNAGFIDHLQMSLRIFYNLVIDNATVSSLSLFSSFIAWIRLKDPSELSILRYYDEVLRNVVVSGVIQADNFNFFHYAFKILGREHARSNGWEKVVKGHRKLLTYIYAHKQGADYLQICLDSEDASVQQAAANMVGMWADKNRGLGLKTEHLDLPPELLKKLADKVGTGEVGWAATNSFGALAKRDPQYLVQTFTSNSEPVLHRIAQLVDESSRRSLAAVRTLVLFFIQQRLSGDSETRGTTTEMRPKAATTTGGPGLVETGTAAGLNGQATTEYVQSATQAAVAENMALPKNIEAELVRKLEILVERNTVQRLRVQAAYLLYLLGKLDDKCHNFIRDIQPGSDTHWYLIEQKMLEFFLEKMPSYPRHVFPDHEDILLS